MFTNDNGGQTQTGARNGPLRGRKGQLFEGGIRVPMAMRWPGHVRPGSVIDDPVIALDLLPTFLCGGRRGDPRRGGSRWPGPGSASRPSACSACPPRDLHWRSHGSAGPVAIRSGKWKLVHARGKEEEGPWLFDLEADLSEESDLAAAHPDRVDLLLQKLAAWEGELVEPRWGGSRKKRK